MRTAAQAIGADAEELVAARLEERGWTILGRNVRVGRAEIDILAVDEAANALVAVEVRWRGRRDYGLPEETVSRAKLARIWVAVITLRETGRQWTASAVRPMPLRVLSLPPRIDIVAVEPGGRLRHHRGVL
jgi:Holliday junction resolvase-like predicted endonuclease